MFNSKKNLVINPTSANLVSIKGYEPNGIDTLYVVEVPRLNIMGAAGFEKKGAVGALIATAELCTSDDSTALVNTLGSRVIVMDRSLVRAAKCALTRKKVLALIAMQNTLVNGTLDERFVPSYNTDLIEDFSTSSDNIVMRAAAEISAAEVYGYRAMKAGIKAQNRRLLVSEKGIAKGFHRDYRRSLSQKRKNKAAVAEVMDVVDNMNATLTETVVDKAVQAANAAGAQAKKVVTSIATATSGKGGKDKDTGATPAPAQA